MHGYYIQISRGQSHLAPINYMRRQTLKNAERYIIPELKEYEDKVLTSKGKALALEKNFMKSCSTCCCRIWKRCNRARARWRNSTCWLTWRSGSYTLNYTCPTFIDKPGIRITEGRHPVVEQGTERTVYR